jgi:serine/threonine protein kinase
MKESARFIAGIQDFTIVKVIGKGGFGTVYLGKRNENGRLYAIKVSLVN